MATKGRQSCSWLTAFSGRDAAEPEPRTIRFNKEQDIEYCTNFVSTTKYTWWNFIPKNLLEQFLRIANLFFLVIAVLSTLSISPLHPVTSISPLVGVLAAQAIKEGIEDFQRHKADKEMNMRKISVIRNDEELVIEWHELQVGDIVYMKTGQPFPADIILLSSNDENGMAYIETANLDGETNLKQRQAMPAVQERVRSHREASDLQGDLNCEPPRKELYSYDGSLDLKMGKDMDTIPLSVNQLLPRGCILRNTAWIYGVVIFTGQDTRVMMNSSKGQIKRSNIERMMNRQITYVFALLVAMCLVVSIGCTVWTTSTGEDLWYLDLEGEGAEEFDPSESGVIWIASFGTHFILFNTLIPISLYVSMEIVKLAIAYFINNDVEIYHPDTDTPALARTSSLVEELGQIQYIFSDKTGTLTRNVMEFLKCSIGGEVYGTGATEIERAAAKRKGLPIPPPNKIPPNCDPGFAFYDETLLYDNWKKEKNRKNIEEFFTHLAVCHTVLPEPKDDGIIKYEATSPDEEALVFAAKNLGFAFYSRNTNSIVVRFRHDKSEKEYEMLQFLEFNSTRKRMSVIFREKGSKDVMLYCKGADSVIYERLRKNDPIADKTAEQLEVFAQQGLRTLCIAKVKLEPKKYEDWAKKFTEASNTLVDRAQKLDDVAELIEKDLELVGATAIEDKLQVGVPETIASLARGNIKIWVLTGDKQETAINIGFACSLLTNDMTLMIVNGESEEDVHEEINKMVEKYGGAEEDEELALIIDGAALKHALSPKLEQDFLALGTKCKAVVCCRVSPLQKAEVTTLVKRHLGQITLGIGDGANDVSMIKAAHIGIGISGQEGMQAVMASDFAIAQFRFLQRLLLVHGRWAYARIAKLVCYFFYKNIAFTFTMFWFSMFCGFSGQRIYDDWYQSFYNLLFTSLPVVLLLFDQDVSADTANEHPELYIPGQKKELFNSKLFLLWCLEALYHSAVFFFVSVGIHSSLAHRDDGTSGYLWVFGTDVYTAVLITVTLRLAIEMHYWTVWNHIAVWGSLTLWFIFIVIYCSAHPGSAGELDSKDNVYQLIFYSFSTIHFWATIIIVPSLCLLPQIAKKHLQKVPLWLHHRARERAKRNSQDAPVPSGSESHSETESDLTEKAMRKFRRVARVASVVSTLQVQPYRGYGFSQEPGNFKFGIDPASNRKEGSKKKQTSTNAAPQKKKSWFR